MPKDPSCRLKLCHLTVCVQKYWKVYLQKLCDVWICVYIIQVHLHLILQEVYCKNFFWNLYWIYIIIRCGFICFIAMDSETLTSSPDADGSSYWASFAMSSFSKGSNMNAHEGILNGNGPRAGEKAIVKAFKHQTGTEELCDLEILKSSTAQKLADVFNYKFGNLQRIAFCQPLKALMDRVAFFSLFSLERKKLSKHEWVLITKNMRKDLHRWISKRGTPCRHTPDIMQSFVHFSYHYTGRKLVLCDFKGIKDEQGFELNTPTIHSHDGQFGECDQGSVGVLRVFDKHTCNDICRNMMVPNVNLPRVNPSSPVDIPLQPSAPYDPCLEWDTSSPMVSYPFPELPPPYQLHPAFTFPPVCTPTEVQNKYDAGSHCLKQGSYFPYNNNN